MTLKVYVVVAWQGDVNGAWYQWFASELRKRGDTQVTVLACGNELLPSLSALSSQLGVGALDEDTYFVGHSVGCQTILRWLATLPENVKIGGALLVAGWVSLQKEDTTPPSRPEWLVQFMSTSFDKFLPWLNTPFDGQNTAARAKNITALITKNDPFTHKWEENKALFSQLVPGIHVEVRAEGGHLARAQEPEVLSLFNKFIEK